MDGCGLCGVEVEGLKGGGDPCVVCSGVFVVLGFFFFQLVLVQQSERLYSRVNHWTLLDSFSVNVNNPHNSFLRRSSV